MAPLPQRATPPLTLLTATTQSDRLAACKLRAAAFCTALPDSTSTYARRRYVATRTAAAWDALEARVKGEDVDWAGIELDTLLGVIPAGSGAPDPPPSDPAARLDGDAGVLLVGAQARDVPSPQDADAAAASPPLLIATLDLNAHTRALPSERLAAPPPDVGIAALTYVSNVAVAPRWRGRGYGRELLTAALERAANVHGARRVAVHAELANEAGMALYAGVFGDPKDVESLKVERAAGRPARALFWVDL